MKAELITQKDGDIRVVNAARVSFNKQKDEIDDKDIGLIQYLVKHNHWTPFSHSRIGFHSLLDRPLVSLVDLTPELIAGMVWNHSQTKVGHSLYGWVKILESHALFGTREENDILATLLKRYPESMKAFGYDLEMQSKNVVVPIDETQEINPYFVNYTVRETVPIFVARQRFKHMVGFTYNEVSRRYVDDEPEFFEPKEWRFRAPNLKQGSSEDVLSLEDSESIDEVLSYITHDVTNLYGDMIDHYKIAPEQARMVLPQSMYTSYYVTGHKIAWDRAINLRSDPHAQKEIRDLAEQWKEIIRNSNRK